MELLWAGQAEQYRIDLNGLLAQLIGTGDPCFDHIYVHCAQKMENLNTHKIAALNCPNCGAAAAADNPACSYCGSTLYTRICAACFSAVSVNMNHCPQCGAAVRESRGAEPKNSLKCPVCESALEIQADYDHPLYSCTQCGGLWLDHDSFQLVCDRVERQVLEQGYKFPEAKASASMRKSRRAYVRCPECGEIMTPKNFSRCSGIIIDCCQKHGNWFDWQELHQIVEFIQKGGMSKSRKLEIDRAREDIRRERDNWTIGSALRRYISDPNIKAPKNS
jgi:Zn-finger nucleic acid-binding protein